MEVCLVFVRPERPLATELRDRLIFLNPLLGALHRLCNELVCRWQFGQQERSFEADLAICSEVRYGNRLSLLDGYSIRSGEEAALGSSGEYW